jgi:hypothetical protein
LNGAAFAFRRTSVAPPKRFPEGGRFTSRANRRIRAMAKIFQMRALRRPSVIFPAPLLPSPVGRLSFRWRCGPVATLLLLFFCGPATICHAQSRDVVCRDGAGEFQAQYLSGVIARVGATRNLELASRACDASLAWGEETLSVATGTPELDIDAFAVDLGLGAPVVAFQVKKSKAACCMEYQIYSLHAPPVLLRTITGGEFFSAEDSDLDGRIEIWTGDAAAVDGFDDLHLRDLDFAPPVVLRFTKGKLMDASAEFQPYFDQKVADVRARLTPEDLAEFKNSDGRLAVATTVPAAKASPLQSVKVKVLEIVWAYLYSGQQEQAWRALSEMWPAADLARIRAAISGARAHGMLAQVEGLSAPVPASRQLHAKIFDGTVTATSTPGLTPKDAKPKQEITPPRAILMEREPPSNVYEAELSRTESLLKLVIDSAGKVRSVEVMGTSQTVDEGLIKSTANWKFIPAFNAGEPVASQIFLGVSLKR